MVQALLHLLGVDNLSGPWYGFWSGIGSDLSEIAGLLTVAWIFYRRHNCHVHGCWRIGRHSVEGTPHVVCRRHGVGLPEQITPDHIAEAQRLAGKDTEAVLRRLDVIISKLSEQGRPSERRPVEPGHSEAGTRLR